LTSHSSGGGGALTTFPSKLIPENFSVFTPQVVLVNPVQPLDKPMSLSRHLKALAVWYSDNQSHNNHANVYNIKNITRTNTADYCTTPASQYSLLLCPEQKNIYLLPPSEQLLDYKNGQWSTCKNHVNQKWLKALF